MSSSGQHAIDVGTMVEAVVCPAKHCGERCGLCEGKRRVPRFISDRYSWPSAFHGTGDK